ncbi:MAG TPA: TlpA disulfide reductase family protein [Planctomycetota bacterium]
MLTSLLLAVLQDLAPGRGEARLETPGGPLRFGLELAVSKAGWSAFLVNGEERIAVPEVHVDGDELRLEMPHYDSRIIARSEAGALHGIWEKRRGREQVARVPFHVDAPTLCDVGTVPVEFEPLFTGRWAVDFETDDQPAVAQFFELPQGRTLGTFLTATGDYRYLDGRREGDKLELSCFDGAHAFLFKAQLQADGSLKGDFWSGNWHHETWSAKRDDAAELADPFAQTTWNGRTRLADLAFPGLDGTKRSLADPAARATLQVVFGSWCPNCNDEAALLKELDATYRERGLRILLLAFELTGDFRRDAEQVRIFQERHGLAELPAFLCGTADKAEATKALGLVDRVRAFPTTIFVGADGLPKAIHSGFAGPATGEEHQRLRRDFAARIEALLPPR